jgi:ribosomal protein S26
MKCSKCGKEVTPLNHFYVPLTGKGRGLRYCIACAREEKIITLV